MTRQLAVGLTPLETRRDVVLHVARRAEELGYDAFTLAEGWGHDAAVLLAEVARETSRIRIGTGILNVWGRSPATIAMLSTSLAEISDGRFFLGLGAGSPPLAEGFHDVPFEAPVEAVGATTRQVRRLLAGQRMEPTNASGTRPLKLALTARPDIQIYLAALGPRAIRMAGELADGWCPFLLPVSGLADAVTLLDDGAAGADRPRPLIAPSIPAAMAADPAETLEIASWWVAFYLVSMGPLYRQTLHRLGYGAAVDQVVAANPTPRTFEVPESARMLLDELTLWGDASSARAALDAWYDAGAQLPILTLPPGRELDTLDRMLEALAPAG
ncbi:MAG TPA: LLM class flavin-dependent oxidoreductase [Nocardioidaceae bacterium]|nr:LLM class flavin-dependent oxidoreductase [Nocardioidaceae bacterium]